MRAGRKRGRDLPWPCAAWEDEIQGEEAPGAESESPSATSPEPREPAWSASFLLRASSVGRTAESATNGFAPALDRAREAEMSDERAAAAEAAVAGGALLRPSSHTARVYADPDVVVYSRNGPSVIGIDAGAGLGARRVYVRVGPGDRLVVPTGSPLNRSSYQFPVSVFAEYVDIVEGVGGGEK